MFRTHKHWLLVPALAALLALAVSASGRAADIDMSGVWKGTYAVDNGEAKATITITKSGGKYSGTIALIDEKINVSIRNGDMDDEYFAVWGVIPTRTPDGQMIQAHFTFGGFVDPAGGVWEGNWTVSDKDGNVGGGNLFTFQRDKAATPGGGSGAPPVPQPAIDGGKPGAVSMAGHWQGTYTQTNKQAGTLSIDLRQAGGSYRGDGRAVDNDGTVIPPITLASGKMSGKRFTTDGTMTLIADDGQEFPATVSLSGDAAGDAWRGNILVKAKIDGEETTVISGMFRLERSSGGGKSSPEIKSGPSGISGGGMSGKGKTAKGGN